MNTLDSEATKLAQDVLYFIEFSCREKNLINLRVAAQQLSIYLRAFLSKVLKILNAIF